ncbi:hypothetical protein L838_4431 [Mycobacterium avium MAV_120709_2344]|nr:hypothetical protein L838_4431 [Mycobacterium avium MAV_120709_2344]
MGTPGIVHQHIKAPVSGNGVIERRHRRRSVSDIHSQRLDLIRMGGDKIIEAVYVAARGDHHITGGDGCRRQLPAKAAGGTGNKPHSLRDWCSHHHQLL